MTTVLQAPSSRLSIPELALVSFLPPHKRAGASNWIKRVPLALVLAIQAFGSLRLRNTAFRDEGLYIWTGRRMFADWFHGAKLYDNPSSYFSGAPGIYPPIAALLDMVGGLTLARGFSLACMLIATVSIASFSTRLFSRRIGLAAALVFALAGPTQHLGNFATFDAMALALIASATALGVRAVQKQKFWYATAVGLMLTLAVATKYAALMFVPIALGVIFLTAAHRLYAPRLALVSFGVFAITLTLVTVTVGGEAYLGFTRTTTERDSLSNASAVDVLLASVRYAGLWYGVAVAGLVAAFVRLRRRWLPLLLILATFAPAIYQAFINETVSLDKHIDFGLVFAAPLIGIAIVQPRNVYLRLAAAALLFVMAVAGAATSRQVFGEWSNTKALTDTLAYPFAAAPYIRTLGAPYEPIRYVFADRTEYWQWDSTDPNISLRYQTPQGQDLRGVEAAKAGLANNYWQVVYFNASTTAKELEPLLPKYGYKLTDTVVLTNNSGDDVYHIWQRFH